MLDRQLFGAVCLFCSRLKVKKKNEFPLIKGIVLPHKPQVACYNGMNVTEESLTLETCSSKSSDQFDIIYDSPFVLDCLAPNGTFEYSDIKWFYRDESGIESKISIRDSPYGMMVNAIMSYGEKLLDMNGVHLIEGQLHFNRAMGGFAGMYFCKIGQQTSTPVRIKVTKDLPPGKTEHDIFDGRCFYPDVQRSPYTFNPEDDIFQSYNMHDFSRSRDVKIGSTLVFHQLCYKTADSLRKELNANNDNEDMLRESYWDTMGTEFSSRVEFDTHFYDALAPRSFLDSDLLHSSLHRITDLGAFRWDSRQYLARSYDRPKIRYLPIKQRRVSIWYSRPFY